MASEWPGLEGMDLAKEVSRLQVERWTGGKWAWGQGYELGGEDQSRPHVVAVVSLSPPFIAAMVAALMSSRIMLVAPSVAFSRWPALT